MANAKPSGPEYAVPQGAVRPEPNHVQGEAYVERKDGVVVKRKIMANGNVQEHAEYTPAFKHKDCKVKVLTEAEWKKQFETKAAK
ncbi:hypothetical protein [Microbulbifer discodermiae]|uniref:hypothetical protein n=1 Tax=Microbulbifer sp. 2201CG32-9 TaxID=3232309 RepID=UPI00345B9989